MGLFEVKVSKKGGNLLITYQFSKIEIPILDIIDVVNDDTYGGEEKVAFRIGTPAGNTDRVVIKTSNGSYILFTNIGGMREKILSFMDS